MAIGTANAAKSEQVRSTAREWFAVEKSIRGNSREIFVHGWRSSGKGLHCPMSQSRAYNRLFSFTESELKSWCASILPCLAVDMRGCASDDD